MASLMSRVEEQTADLPGEPRYVARARPIFVVGAARSGVSLLTLSLAQHRNLSPVLETNWYARLSKGMEQAFKTGLTPRETSQLDAGGWDFGSFSAVFGDAIDQMMARSLTPRVEGAAPPVRWIDGSRDLARQLVPLLRLFPNAKVIHVVRDAGEVVATFTNRENRTLYRSRSVYLPAELVTSRWMAAVTNCVEVERAYGSETVLRVFRRDLVRDPEAALSQCLTFIGEPFDPACLRPFRPLQRADGAASERPMLAAREDRVPVNAAAEALSQALLAEGTPSYPRDDLKMLMLDLSFGRRGEPRRDTDRKRAGIGQRVLPRISAPMRAGRRRLATIASRLIDRADAESPAGADGTGKTR